MNRIITGNSLIKGIFRELSILGQTITFKQNQKKTRSRIILLSDTDRNTGHDEALLFPDLTTRSSTAHISFELDGLHYEAKLTSSEKVKNGYSIPKKLLKSQRRINSRSETSSVTRDTILAELRGKSWRIFGTLKEFSKTHIVAITESSVGPFITNEPFDIKLYTRNHQSLSAQGLIEFIRCEPASNSHELVIRLEKHKTNKARRTRPRIDINQPKVIDLNWPDEDGIRFQVTLENIGVLGFSGYVHSKLDELPPLGSICNILDIGLKAKLAWASDISMGFDLRVNERPKLLRWISEVDKLTKTSLLDIPKTRQRKQLLKIMLRSGYLKGHKAKQFSDLPELIQSIPNSLTSRSWLKRFTNTVSRQPDSHVSFSKLSDSCWMIQEVAQCSEKTNIGSELITNALMTFFFSEIDYIGTKTKLISLVDSSSKFTKTFWDPKKNRSNSIQRPAIVVDVLRGKSPPPQSTSKKAIAPSLDDWPKTYEQLSLIFPEPLLNAFGLQENHFSAIELKCQLAESGYILDRKVAILHHNNQPNGVAVTFGLPVHANLTATANHLWILLEDPKEIQPAISSLYYSKQTSEIFNGITEAVIVLNTENLSIMEIANQHQARTRLFSLFVIPMHKIPQFLGEKSEQ